MTDAAAEKRALFEARLEELRSYRDGFLETGDPYYFLAQFLVKHLAWIEGYPGRCVGMRVRPRGDGPAIVFHADHRVADEKLYADMAKGAVLFWHPDTGLSVDETAEEFVRPNMEPPTDPALKDALDVLRAHEIHLVFSYLGQLPPSERERAALRRDIQAVLGGKEWAVVVQDFLNLLFMPSLPPLPPISFPLSMNWRLEHLGHRIERVMGLLPSERLGFQMLNFQSASLPHRYVQGYEIGGLCSHLDIWLQSRAPTIPPSGERPSWWLENSGLAWVGENIVAPLLSQSPNPSADFVERYVREGTQVANELSLFTRIELLEVQQRRSVIASCFNWLSEYYRTQEETKTTWPGFLSAQPMTHLASTTDADLLVSECEQLLQDADIPEDVISDIRCCIRPLLDRQYLLAASATQQILQGIIQNDLQRLSDGILPRSFYPAVGQAVGTIEPPDEGSSETYLLLRNVEQYLGFAVPHQLDEGGGTRLDGLSVRHVKALRRIYETYGDIQTYSALVPCFAWGQRRGVCFVHGYYYRKLGSDRSLLESQVSHRLASLFQRLLRYRGETGHVIQQGQLDKYLSHIGQDIENHIRQPSSGGFQFVDFVRLTLKHLPIIINRKAATFLGYDDTSCRFTWAVDETGLTENYRSRVPAEIDPSFLHQLIQTGGPRVRENAGGGTRIFIPLWMAGTVRGMYIILFSKDDRYVGDRVPEIVSGLSNSFSLYSAWRGLRSTVEDVVWKKTVQGMRHFFRPLFSGAEVTRNIVCSLVAEDAHTETSTRSKIYDALNSHRDLEEYFADQFLACLETLADPGQIDRTFKEVRFPRIGQHLKRLLGRVLMRPGYEGALDFHEVYNHLVHDLRFDWKVSRLHSGHEEILTLVVFELLHNAYKWSRSRIEPLRNAAEELGSLLEEIDNESLQIWPEVELPAGLFWPSPLERELVRGILNLSRSIDWSTTEEQQSGRYAWADSPGSADVSIRLRLEQHERGWRQLHFEMQFEHAWTRRGSLQPERPISVGTRSLPAGMIEILVRNPFRHYLDGKSKSHRDVVDEFTYARRLMGYTDVSLEASETGRAERSNFGSFLVQRIVSEYFLGISYPPEPVGTANDFAFRFEIPNDLQKRLRENTSRSAFR